MSTSKNKENIRRHVEEVWNKGKLDVIPELISPKYIVHPNYGDEVKGQDGFKQLVTMMRTAAPDLRFTIDSMVAEGDIVAARYTATGTFTGEIPNFKPTGKKFKRSDAIFHRFEGGKQVEAWTFSDQLSEYRQMGIPIPKE
jgi:predicted ester cyclase